MQTYNILVLTEHGRHAPSNSLYPLAQAMRKNPYCQQIVAASRTTDRNQDFFAAKDASSLWVSAVDEQFTFSEGGQAFAQLQQIDPSSYDIILLRLPHPVEHTFLAFLEASFPKQLIINNPAGIRKVADKTFLLRYPDLCPPMKLCQNADEVRAFAQKFAIVLKPLHSYGGKGIVRIKDGLAEWDGQSETLESFLQSKDAEYPYLGMKFLKNVTKGDKRIVLVNGRVIGASLRLPPPDSWLCNVSQGGQAQPTQLSPEEEHIIDKLAPMLIQNGIVMAGIDTLTDDSGKRVLSEINALSVGGLNDLGDTPHLTAADRTATLIWQYIATQLLSS